jgi:hypothetical protein
MDMRVGDIWINGGGTHERYEILEIGYHEIHGIIFDFRYLDGSEKGHVYRDGVLRLALASGDHPDEITLAKQILRTYEET